MIDKARKFAIKKHKGQTYGDGDFMVHPWEVYTVLSALLMIQNRQDDNLLVASLLHDTLEDTETTYKELKKEFGKDIADLVKEVTATEWNVFPNLKTQRGIMLKFADRLANISNMGKWTPENREKYIEKSKFWKDEL